MQAKKINIPSFYLHNVNDPKYQSWLKQYKDCLKKKEVKPKQADNRQPFTIKETKVQYPSIQDIPYSDLERDMKPIKQKQVLNSFSIVHLSAKQKVKPKQISFRHQPVRITYKNL